MTAVGDDPDLLYRPLEGPLDWTAASAAVDDGQWALAVAARSALASEAPAWSALAGRGTLVAGAYQSGGLAGLYTVGDPLARRLAAGVAAASDVGPRAAPHVRALAAAVRSAAGPSVASGAGLCHLHATACHPQLHHSVQAGSGDWHDHVLGHGDLKHHANHRPVSAGGWVARAPVSAVVDETGRLAEWLGSWAYAGLHPAARAAYALHALSHVGPFAAGNGRVGRTIATAVLLDAAGLPLWVPAADGRAYRQAISAADDGDRTALVRFVVDQTTALAQLLTTLHAEAGGAEEQAALARWTAREDAARLLIEQAAAAAEKALARHQSRTDLGWLADLSGATVTAGDLIVLSAPVDGGGPVDETLAVDPHPLEGAADQVILRAREADLALTTTVEQMAAGGPPELPDMVERAVTALALRAAAAD